MGGTHAAGGAFPARLVAACRRVWATVAEGHRTLRRPRVILPLGSASIARWAARWGSVYAVLRAFDIPGPTEAATLILVSTSVAQTLPVVPGNLGVCQVAVALSLVASSGTPATVAVAIGVVLQAVQTAPIALAGAAAAARQGETSENSGTRPAASSCAPRDTDERGRCPTAASVAAGSCALPRRLRRLLRGARRR